MGIQLPTAHNPHSHMSQPSIFSTERPRRLERSMRYARSLPLGEARIGDTVCNAMGYVLTHFTTDHVPHLNLNCSPQICHISSPRSCSWRVRRWWDGDNSRGLCRRTSTVRITALPLSAAVATVDRVSRARFREQGWWIARRNSTPGRGVAVRVSSWHGMTGRGLTSALASKKGFFDVVSCRVMSCHRRITDCLVVVVSSATARHAYRHPRTHFITAA